MDDPSITNSLIDGATGYDSLVSYATGAADLAVQKTANNIYHSPVSNSSSKVEAYRKLLDVANEADKVRSLSKPIQAVGKWGGAAGATVGGAVNIYGDLTNSNYTKEDKAKAVTVDVIATGASIAAGIILASVSLPVVGAIAAGVTVGVIISYGASWAKEGWID